MFHASFAVKSVVPHVAVSATCSITNILLAVTLLGSPIKGKGLNNTIMTQDIHTHRPPKNVQAYEAWNQRRTYGLLTYSYTINLCWITKTGHTTNLQTYVHAIDTYTCTHIYYSTCQLHDKLCVFSGYLRASAMIVYAPVSSNGSRKTYIDRCVLNIVS